MDTDLIRVVNKLQDTFATLGGDLDMPQLVVVCDQIIRPNLHAQHNFAIGWQSVRWEI